jgi:PTH1 family peptidyl-tRNA hydrolase
MIDNKELEQFDISKIKLIVGLGNVGREYDQTRHNIGFEFLDFFAKSSRFQLESKLKAYLHSILVDNRKVILAKPSTFMNMSGESVNLIAKYYNIKPEEILVVHDDLDLRLGTYKIQFAKGPKVHNGILSVEKRLGTADFWRLRVGVDNREVSIRDYLSGSSYVLSRFAQKEYQIVLDTFQSILESL